MGWSMWGYSDEKMMHYCAMKNRPNLSMDNSTDDSIHFKYFESEGFNVKEPLINSSCRRKPASRPFKNTGSRHAPG